MRSSSHHVVLLFLCLLLTQSICYSQSDVTVGVLAYRGEEKAVDRWQATITYLDSRITDRKIHLLPLSLDQVENVIKNKEIDYLISNTGNYVQLENKYGISRIATLINKRLGKESTQFGAVIFTRADRHDINTLRDLRGKTFVGVDRDAFGGFQMAWRELQDLGIDPFTDLSQLHFSGFPINKVLLAVLDGKADAGTFRSDSLEQMAAEGIFNLKHIKILNSQLKPDFPYLLSTRLYPEWPFAKLKHTSKELTRQIAVALLEIDANGPEATAAKSAGWHVPLDYQAVHELMKELRIGPYENMAEITVKNVVQHYWQSTIGILLAIIAILGISSYVICLNKKLRSTNKRLQTEIKQGKSLTKQLKHKALHDELTGIHNRAGFEQALRREFVRASRNSRMFSIMFIDLDNFKEINDSLGHYAGDCLLKAVADRINQTLRESDLLARMGGDEFAIINYDVESHEIIQYIAQRVVDCFAIPFNIEDSSIITSCSIGIAIYPQHGPNTVSLMCNADTAMYQAKREKVGFAFCQHCINKIEDQHAH